MASKKTILLFAGWSRTRASYKKLIEGAPLPWEVFVASYEDLMPTGSIEGFERNVLDFAAKHKLSDFVLVGHSLGGALALEFALHYPDRVKKLILVDSEGIFGNESLFWLFRNFMRTTAQHGSKKRAENMKAFWRIVQKAWIHYRLARHAHHADLREKAEKLEAPVLVLWGEKDRLTPLWQGEQLHQSIQGAEIFVLEGMDHDWILHSPEKFWDMVNR